MREKLKNSLTPLCIGLVLGLALGLFGPGLFREAKDPVENDLNPAVPLEREGRIDLNTAGEAQLQELPGIGATLAKRILEYREANGSFRSVWELTAVSGVGEGLTQNLAPYVYVTVSEKE